MRFTGTKDPVANQAAVVELREYVTGSNSNIYVRIAKLSSCSSRALMDVAFQHEENGLQVKHRLEEFEIACLSNLNPEEVEEAVALVPSLQKHFTDSEIEEIMGIISRTTARMRTTSVP